MSTPFFQRIKIAVHNSFKTGWKNIYLRFMQNATICSIFSRKSWIMITQARQFRRNIERVPTSLFFFPRWTAEVCTPQQWRKFILAIFFSFLSRLRCDRHSFHAMWYRCRRQFLSSFIKYSGVRHQSFFESSKNISSKIIWN